MAPDGKVGFFAPRKQWEKKVVPVRGWNLTLGIGEDAGLFRQVMVDLRRLVFVLAMAGGLGPVLDPIGFLS